MPSPLTTSDQVVAAEAVTVSPVADLLAATAQLTNFTVPAEDLVTAASGSGTLGRIQTLYAAFWADMSGLGAKIHALALMLEALLPDSAPQTLDHLTLSISVGSVKENGTAPSLTLHAWQDAGATVPYTDPLSPAASYAGNNGSVATIGASSGVISIQGPGDVTFTVDAGGKSTSVGLTVVAEVLSATPSSLGFTVGDGPSAPLVIRDQDAVNVTSGGSFGSSDSAVATVDSSGVVTPVGVGSCDVVFTQGGTGETCTIAVTVAAESPLAAVPSTILMSPGAYPIQLLITDSGTDVTTDAGTAYALDTLTLGTVDAPTLTSVSPATIVQGTSGSYSFTGTNIRAGQTIGGLPTGVVASSYVYTGTLLTCTLTAAADATTGVANVYIEDDTHGNSGTKALTVNTPAPVVPSVVQSKTLNFGSGTVKTATFTGNVTAGNYVCVLGNAGAGGTLTVTDSNGDTISPVHAVNTDLANSQIFVGKIGATGPLTVTLTFTSSTDGQYLLHELTGIAGASPVDVYGTHSNNQDATKETANLTTTVDGDFLMMLGVCGSNYITPGTGSTQASQTANARYVTSAYSQLDAHGAYQKPWSGSGSYWVVLAVALKPA